MAINILINIYILVYCERKLKPELQWSEKRRKQNENNKKDENARNGRGSEWVNKDSARPD